jgi:hypothetical protein
MQANYRTAVSPTPHMAVIQLSIRILTEAVFFVVMQIQPCRRAKNKPYAISPNACFRTTDWSKANVCQGQ